MKKFYFITSVLAITTVIGSAQAKDFTIDTSGASTTVDITGLSVSDVTGLTDTLNSKANINSVYSKTDVDAKLATKADAATTYTKTEVDTAVGAKADKATTLAGYGITDAYTKTEVDTAVGAKADKATTLAGYGITDAYTKTEVDNEISTATTLTTAATSSAGYAANDSVLTAVTKIDGALKTAEDDIAQNKADIAQNKSDIAQNKADIGSMTFTGNAASEKTLTDAINALDGVIGDYSTLSNTNGNLSGTNIVADLDAIDAAIGAAVTGTNGNVVATNSINENLDAIDAAIGDRSTLSATNNNLTAGSTIVEGLNALDATLGDVKNVSNANGNIGGATVAAKLDAIDTNMGDLATLTHGAFGGTTTDITTAMNTLASNVEAATGGTFAADGSWSGSVSVGSSADYTYGTAATNVMEAVNQVATNIGTAVTGTNGNIDAANTVNANLDSLDAAIGDRSAVASLNSAINTAVATDVSTAIETTGNLIGDMNFGSTNYLAGVTNLSDAVRTLDTNIQRVEHKLHNVEYRLKSGLAAMSALSALVPNARDCGNTQISVGTGGYSDRMGIALGGFHYFNDHVLFNAGASYGGTRDWAFRAGITFGI